jgi:hypothetical protein
MWAASTRLTLMLLLVCGWKEQLSAATAAAVEIAAADGFRT